MNFVRCARRTEKHEGFRARPYKDTEGVWTIGIGNTEWRGQPVTENTPAVTLKEARHEMYADLYQACIDAQLYFPNFESLSPLKQEVLVEMAYQMGYANLCEFKRLNQALTLRDSNMAAREMRNSQWYRQTPERAQELIDLVLQDD